MKITSVAVLTGFVAATALADANVEQKTQFQIKGAVGAIVNVFSRTAREGVTSTTVIKGDRKLTRAGDSGEIIDLREEKVYNVDFARKTYTVKTFADLRREFEEQQEKMKKEAAKQEKSAKSEKNEGPEYEVDFDVKSTGAKETIAGFNTHQEIITVKVHEKGKKIEQSGGWVLTADEWIGPKVPAMREIVDFDLKFAQKVYGSAMPDMRQVAMAMAATPAFGKAMKVFAEKGKNLDGTAIRTNMKFETIAGSDPSTQQAKAEEEKPTSVQSAVIGGLFNKMKKRQEEKKAEAGQDPNRSELFSTTSEVMRAAGSSSSDDVAIPAGFKQR